MAIKSRYNVVPMGDSINIVQPKSGADILLETLADVIPTQEDKRADAKLELERQRVELAELSQRDSSMANQKTLDIQKRQVGVREGQLAELKNQNKLQNDKMIVDSLFENKKQGYSENEVSSMIDTMLFSPIASKIFKAKNNRLNKEYESKERVASAYSTLAKNMMDVDIEPIVFMNGEVTPTGLADLFKQKIANERTISPEKKIKLESLFKTVTALEKEKAELGQFIDTRKIDARIKDYYNAINKMTNDSMAVGFTEVPKEEKEKGALDNILDSFSSSGFLGIGGGNVQAANPEDFNLDDFISNSPIEIETTGTDNTSVQDTIKDLDNNLYNDIF